MATDPGRSVLVAGGGVIGLATAAALLEREPGLSVTVLDKAAAGGGASRHAGALDIPYFRTAFHRRLVKASWAWHQARPAQAAGYRRPVPMTWYAEPGLDLQPQLAMPLSDGAPEDSGWLPPPGVRALRGEAFVIDPGAWCRALAREVTESGRGEVVERAEVVAIKSGPREATVTCADGRTYAAGHVVLALGPWLPGWDARTRAWSTARGLRTKRVFGLNVEVAPEVRSDLAVGWPAADIYFHPAPSGDGHRLSLRHDEWGVDPDAPHRMAAAVLDRAAPFLDRLLGPGRWSVAGDRVFADSYTPEHEPVVASCDALGRRVTIATGTHGSGVRLGPGIAMLVASTVLDSLKQTWGVA